MQRGSQFWNALLKAARPLRDGFRMRIGNGETSFWYEDWLGTGPLYNSVFVVDIHDTALRICDLWDNQSWHLQHLYTVLPVELQGTIQATNFHLNEDILYLITWAPNLSGCYTVKDGYKWLREQELYVQYLAGSEYQRDSRTGSRGGYKSLVIFSLLQFGFFGVEGMQFVSSKNGRRSLWHCPSEGEVALNVDGSSLGNPCLAGFGGLVRDHKGEWILGFMGGVGMSDILQVELLAILHGLRLVWNCGYRRVRCFTDSMLALKLIKNTTSLLHQYAPIIVDIKHWMAQDWSLSIVHILREGNQCANHLAKLGSSSNSRLQVLQLAPPSLLPMLLADSCGTLFPRV
ncbi:Ribonuclease H domain [Sesbania bispinosa]|nr:Ribonuclease H domain [Sesbania bispinosa]